MKSLGKTQAMSHLEEDSTTDAAEGDTNRGGAQRVARGASANDAVAMDLDAVGPPGVGGDGGGDGAGPSQSASGPAEQPLMVVPGRVVHLKGREAFVRAVEGDPLMPELRRIVVTQRCAPNRRSRVPRV